MMFTCITSTQITSFDIHEISINARTWCHSLESESLVIFKQWKIQQGPIELENIQEGNMEAAHTYNSAEADNWKGRREK